MRIGLSHCGFRLEYPCGTGTLPPPAPRGRRLEREELSPVVERPSRASRENRCGMRSCCMAQPPDRARSWLTYLRAKVPTRRRIHDTSSGQLRIAMPPPRPRLWRGFAPVAPRAWICSLTPDRSTWFPLPVTIVRLVRHDRWTARECLETLLTSTAIERYSLP